MLSYIFLFFSSLIFLHPKKIELKKDNSYAIIFSSFIFANLFLGFISLILIYLGKSNFPIILISIILFTFTFLIDKKSKNKILNLKNFISSEFKKFIDFNSHDDKEKKILYFILFIFISIFISSIGPINHPDASDYHVGYPYQYYIRGKFFIDGGLTQGLLGISEYANLAFIQERMIWLIRTLQIINLPFLILFLTNKIRNNILILAFLSVPTFIQWSTIGKPFFLGESSLIIIFLIWNQTKDSQDLKLLLMSAISCMTFKISSLIIIFPMFLAYLNYLSNNKYSLKAVFQESKKIIVSKEIILTTIILTTLLISKLIITGNFIYPLFTNLFNKNDQLINDFSNNIFNYARNDSYILNIFIPIKKTYLASSLGPTILIILITLILKKSKKLLLKIDTIFLVTVSQLILLLTFCQRRSDFYAAPLILIIFQSKQIKSVLFNFKIKYLFFISLIFQVSLIVLLTIFSIFININSFVSYKNTMYKTAYGFSLSSMIDPNLDGNILIEDRNTRLYYPKNYIDVDKMRNCRLRNKNLGFDANDICLKKYNINQVISDINYKANRNFFDCHIINSFKASRNFFRQIKDSTKYCIRK